MNQVADILNLAKLAQQQNVDAVLATVVRTEGSAYRHVGAMMLICADGRSVGMISGGCLEPHIIKRAFWLTRNGASVQVYQTGDEQREYDNDSSDEPDLDSDDELNFGLGCNGKVHVLFERLTSANPLLGLIDQVRRDQHPITIATLIRVDKRQSQDAPLQIGTRINIDAYNNSGQIVTIDGQQYYSEPFNLLKPIVEELSAYKFNKRNSAYVVIQGEAEGSCKYSTENDSIRNDNTENTSKQKSVPTEWLIQRLCPQKRLLVCGAGNDVMPLVTMAKLQDWYVTVIDSRSQYATRARFPRADSVMCLPLEDSETLIELSNHAAVAVMSHSLSQDRARLAVLLMDANFDYLGQLGPRYRTERLIQEISATMNNPIGLARGIAKLHYPIGYKLGGDGPEALALSIMAQMSAVMNSQAQTINDVDNTLDNKGTSQSLAQVTTEPFYINSHTKSYAHD